MKGVRGYDATGRSSKSKNNQRRRKDVIQDCIESLEIFCFAVIFGKETQSPAEVATYIASFAAFFKKALDIPARPTSLKRPTFLDHSMVFKMAVISMMLIHLTDKQDIKGICFALTVNFFIILMEATEKCLESLPVIHTLRNMDDVTSSDFFAKKESEEDGRDESDPKVNDNESDDNETTSSTDEDSDESDYDSDFEVEDSPSKFPGRRRRRVSSLSHDMSDLDDDVPDVSSLSIMSNLSPKDRDDDFMASQTPETSRSPVKEASIPDLSVFKVFPKLHLQTLKVLVDFISASKDFMENEELKSRLQDRMVNVINIFVQMEQICLKELQRDVPGHSSHPDWKQELALDCDWSLILFPPLKDTHEHLDFTPGKRLTDKDAGIVSIQRLISFSLSLAKETGRYVWDSEPKQLKPA